MCFKHKQMQHLLRAWKGSEGQLPRWDSRGEAVGVPASFVALAHLPSDFPPHTHVLETEALP